MQNFLTNTQVKIYISGNMMGQTFNEKPFNILLPKIWNIVVLDIFFKHPIMLVRNKRLI